MYLDKQIAFGEVFRGLYSAGGLLAGGLIGLWRLHKTGVSADAFADAASVPLCLMLAVGRVGCLIEGCCSGISRVSDEAPRFWLHFAGEPDNIWRFPSQPAESAAALCIAVMLTLLSAMLPKDKRQNGGILFPLAMIFYGSYRLISDPYRQLFADGLMNINRYVWIAGIAIGTAWLLKTFAARTGKKAGMALIEVLLAVGLVGIIAAAGLAPLIVTVRSLENAQARWGRRHNVPEAAEAIFRDLRHVIQNPSFDSVRIEHKERLSNEADDRILMWSLSPKFEDKGAALVVYKVVPEDSFSKDEPGLYRWVLFGRQPFEDMENETAETPIEIDPDNLEADTGNLILSEAGGLRIYFPKGEEWEQKDYSGDIPEILRIEILLEESSYVRTEVLAHAITADASSEAEEE